MGKNESNWLLQVAVLLLLVFQSCQFPNKEKSPSINGNWKSIGYGKILSITDTIVKSFNISKINCIPDNETLLQDFKNQFSIISLNNDSLILKDEITDYYYVRIKNVPDIYTNSESRNNNDPILNFETLWNTFDELYGFFKVRQIDWNKIRDKYRPKLSEETTPLDLFLVLEKMLAEIGDGHTYIKLPDSLKEEYKKFKDHNTSLKDENNSKKKNELPKMTKKEILDHYLCDVKTYNSGLIYWGKIQNDIGYVQINGMEGFADYGIDTTMDEKEFWKQYWKQAGKSSNYALDLVDGTRAIMDTITKEFRNVKSLILDLRFNGGGWDIVSLEIMNHFINHETKAFTKNVRNGEGFSRKQQIYLHPGNFVYTGDVFILTGPRTASAAEVMVLSSMYLPNIKRVGSKTKGIYSDVLGKKLPNGWEYTLSNEIYKSNEGICYESIGISPHYETGYDHDYSKQLVEQQTNGDEAIELVLKLKNIK